MLSNLRAVNAAAGVVLGLELTALQKDPIVMTNDCAAGPTFMVIHCRQCSFCSVYSHLFVGIAASFHSTVIHFKCCRFYGNGSGPDAPVTCPVKTNSGRKHLYYTGNVA